MARRANHEGTAPRQRKDGLFYASIQLDGVRHWAYGRTPKAVRQKITELRQQHTRGLDIAQADTPLADYLRHWLETTVRRKREGTYLTYEQTVRCHIVPHPARRPLGTIPLGKLRPSHIEAWVEDRRATGMADSTLWRLHAILRAGLNRAVKADILAKNPASQIDPIVVEETEVVPLSREEARTVLAAVAGTREHAFYAIAFSFGLREGELIGLRWEDLDFEQRTLSLRVQLQRGQLVPLKRTWQRRTLVLSAWLVELLRAHQELLLATCALAGDKWVEHGLVFPTAHGTPQRPFNTWQAWQRLLKRLQIPRRKFHATRHTAATLALQDGVPLWEVSRMLGHKSIDITAKVYAHLVPESYGRIAERMSAVLNGAVSDRTVVGTVAPAPETTKKRPLPEIREGALEAAAGE